MTRTAARVFLSLSAALALSTLFLLEAQPPQPPAKQRPKQDPKQLKAAKGKQPEPVPVSLTLLNTLTTRPLSEIRVNLTPANRTALTTGSGLVEIALPPGEHKIEAAGYAPQSFTVEEGEPLQFTLPMTPIGSIRGRVLDPNGAPLPGALVSALEMSWIAPQRSLTARTGLTDLNGVFRLDNITGRAVVRVIPPDGVPEPNKRTEIRYYPNGETLAQAVPVDVLGGAVVELADLRLQTRDAFQIRGRVSGAAAGNVVLQSLAFAYRGAFVATTRARTDAAQSESAAIQPDGSFVFPGILPGVYRLTYALNNTATGGSAIDYAEFVVSITDRDIAEVLLQPYNVTDVVGTITLEANVGLKMPEAVLLHPLHEPFPAFKATVASNGTFRLRGVFPAEYAVEIVSPPVYVSSMLTESHDVTPGILNPRGMTEPLLVRVNLARGKLSGRLRVDPPRKPGGIWVTIAPEDPYRDRFDLYQSIRTNKDGEFVFPNVAPLVYRVFAWEKIEPVLRHSPDFLELFQGVSAVLTNQYETSVEIPLIPSMEIERAKLAF